MTIAYRTKQEIRDYILRKLGGTNVAVELSPEQLDDSIQDSLDKFNHYLCKAEPRTERNRTGAVKIPLNAGDRGVVECKILFPEDYRVYAQMNIFEIMYRMVFPRMPLGDWYMLKTYYKEYQKIRGTDPDWYFDESAMVLYVDCWSGPYDIYYVVARDLQVEDIAALKGAYSSDFRRLAVAEAKVTLARIRGKFGDSIPTPGGAMSTDASNLLGEAATEKAEIEAKLEKVGRFSFSAPVMFG